MIQIHQNYSLKHNNTFGINVFSPLFTEPQTISELEFALNYSGDRSLDRLIIGEGSNLLFTAPFSGLLIHPVMQGIEKVDESSSEVLVKAGAGMNWDTFVAYCVQQKWYGTENLSLIPGSVGAAPVQNIGAYGVEAKDMIEYVEVLDTIEMKPAVLSNAACEFGYRDSVFKHGAQDRYIVSGVVFRLKKKGGLLLEYGNVKELFLKASKQDLQGVRDTIIAIRQSKLPDPVVSGNAGSFFKNPVISKEQFLQIEANYTTVPNYPAGQDKIKVPAAWLIEQAGWKGVREGDVGTWPLQPLVIVNYGSATGKEIYDFSEKIRQSVAEKFSIGLEREVTVIGSW